MIAWDIDGVFLPDQTNVTNEVLRVRAFNLLTIFQPPGEYVMITGRPSEDIHDTRAWVDTAFDNKPKCVYHSRMRDEKPEEYKSKVLNANSDITVFIESDRAQAAYIESHKARNYRVIVWADFIQSKLKELIL